MLSRDLNATFMNEIDIGNIVGRGNFLRALHNVETV